MKGQKVHLRAVEPTDLPLLYEWENDVENWEVSHTMEPYSKALLEKFIETSAQGLYGNRQQRLMVVTNGTNETVGAIDIFDFDPQNRRAGIGILINKKHRHNGFGLEAVELTKKYLFETVNLHQIYCNILIDNSYSLQLFQKAGFEICGKKKDWCQTKNGWTDEYFLQILKPSK